jgi:hypothetical protein
MTLVLLENQKFGLRGWAKMVFDWPQLERKLFDLASTDVHNFGGKHSSESFYGFAFDCNAESGDVFLCFNSVTDLRERAEEYHLRHPEKTVAYFEEELRWRLGDWKYHEFNSEGFYVTWTPLRLSVWNICMNSDTATSEQAASQFMVSATSVLARMEVMGIFDSINRTPDFKTIAINLHDSLEHGWQKFEKVRGTFIK